MRLYEVHLRTELSSLLELLLWFLAVHVVDGLAFESFGALVLSLHHFGNHDVLAADSFFGSFILTSGVVSL